jgi:hypothetical protein
MSTGADCSFSETSPGVWYYKIQRWPYGEWPEYDKHGPFNSFSAARQHLDDNYANPGGWSVYPHIPDHIHEWIKDWDGKKFFCDSCGEEK